MRFEGVVFENECGGEGEGEERRRRRGVRREEGFVDGERC